MKDINTKRIIFWGLIFIIALACTIIGYLKYLEGYGKQGAARVLLIPISEKLNSLYPNMTSKVTLNGLTIKNGDTKYKFLSEDYNTIPTIVLTYDKNDTKAEECVKAVIETISVIKGNTHGLLTSKYDYSKFNSTSVIQGITVGITSDDINKMKAEINLDTNLYKNLLATFKNDEENNIDNLLDTISSEGKFEYNENSILIYIEATQTTYDIYTLKEINEETKNLLLDIINKLNNEIYLKLLTNNETFIDAKTEENYIVELNVTNPNTTLFDGQENITKISINK